MKKVRLFTDDGVEEVLEKDAPDRMARLMLDGKSVTYEKFDDETENGDDE